MIKRRVHTANKEYRCSSCGDPIHIGDQYIRGYGEWDDTISDPPMQEFFECENCNPWTITAHNEGTHTNAEA